MKRRGGRRGWVWAASAGLRLGFVLLAGVLVLALFVSLVGDLQWRCTNLVSGETARASLERSWVITMSKGVLDIERVPADGIARDEQKMMLALMKRIATSEGLYRLEGFRPANGALARRRDGLTPMRQGPNGPEYNLLHYSGGAAPESDDLDLTRELARLGGIAIANARIIAEEKAIAEGTWRWVSTRKWHRPANLFDGVRANPVGVLFGSKTPVTPSAVPLGLQTSGSALLRGNPSTQPDGWLLKIPLIIPACVTGFAALMICYRAIRRWRRHRRGECEGCGYDLRESAGRCPECGGTNDRSVVVSPTQV